jgi:hypothetical protein
MAYDPKRGVSVMYLGSSSAGDQTWQFDGTTWAKMSPSTPVGVSNPVMAYVPAMEKVVLFGGDHSGSITSRMYVWDGANWMLRGPFANLQRKEHAMTDDGTGRLFVYGGCTAVSTTTCNTVLGTTMFYDGATWVQEELPPGRIGAAAAYLPGGKIVRIGGGADFNSAVQPAPTWELTRRGWQSFPAGPGANDSPPGLLAASMIYDSRRDQLVLFGGTTDGSTITDDRTWLRTGTTWTAVHPTPSPPARAAAAMAYDASRGTTLLFGGLGTGSTFRGDTWIWNGTSWTEVTTPGPSARSGSAMAYDPINEVIVLFAGSAGTSAIGDDTWIWNGTGWTEVTTRVGNQPPAVSVASLTWDPAGQRMLLTGGFLVAFDTWEWTGSVAQSQWSRVSTFRVPPSRAFDVVLPSVDGSGIASFGANNTTSDVWELRSEGTRASDGCTGSLDSDGDMLVGCADPDCWPICMPLCPPATSCPTTAPTCGDGTCSALETCHTCPADCVTCTPVCGDFVCDPGESCPGECP